MKKEKPLVLLLALIILLNTFVHSINISSNNAFAHSFTQNNYARFVALIDQFQIESKLVYENLLSNNSSLADKHANEAINIFLWDLMIEMGERDKKISDEVKTAVESLQNISSSISSSSSTNSIVLDKQELTQQAGQLVADIGANTDTIINMTEARQQTEENNPLNQFMAFFSSIFTGQKDSTETSIDPMRFVEVVNSVLRNYGDAYDVDFDMTDMSYMTTISNNSSITVDNRSEANSNMSNMKHINSIDNSTVKINSIENTANYQSARALSEKLLEIFEKELEPIILNKGESVLNTNLKNGIMQLTSSIKDKASPTEIMMIAHTKIHPNLITAFNLQIISSDT